jgi:cytochrome c-type biogenesis protein CcmH
MRKAISVLALVLIVSALALPASAQTPTPDQIDAVAKELWCPLCNGVRLDNCELQACIQMREVIAQKLAAGENKEQIKAYFAQQYGDVVLGTPSREGFNLVVWIFPILAAVVGLGWVAYLVMTWRKRASGPSNVRPPAPQPVRAAPAGPAGPTRTDAEYLRRVDQELKDLE